jgi:uncharacterized membrane protein
MSDTTKLIIGIALAIVVLVLIVWLFASARRRETEAQRMEAEAVRARLAERLPVVQEREDRASVTARIAEEARREAEAAAAEAARLEREAAAHRTEADRLQDEQAALARQADLLDPDVLTDEEGYRVDESGRRLTGSTVASALGVGAAALAQEDDEPDLADHENPFAAYAPSADWVNDPVDDEAADELEARAEADSQAADWINGPDEDEATAPPAHSTVLETSAQNLPGVSGTEGEPSTGSDAGAPFDLEDERPMSRRISSREEVVDGGYGAGSAAALPDGAQPLGHPIMGFRDSKTFAREGEGAPGATADVWFHDEDAARRSGFRPVGGE